MGTIAGALRSSDVNALVDLRIPEKKYYTTLAGFSLSPLRPPLRGEGRHSDFGGFRLTVEKMIKRRIALIEVAPLPAGDARAMKNVALNKTEFSTTTSSSRPSRRAWPSSGAR